MIAPPLSIYVHLPWCVRKCPYCDFNSHVAPPDLPQARYIDWLLHDLDHDLQWVADRQVHSIFFGGGTPSLFAPEQISRLLQGLRTRIPHASDVEVTMEANPGTIEHGRFAGYREAGVTRISLGVQTFNDKQLQRLGRIHSSAQVHTAVDELRTAGFDNFNLDLMYALPEQTLAQALHDVEQAIALSPAHVSHYQLTLEPGTVFFHQPPPLPDDDTAWSMQLECQSLLAAQGYQHYEVSAYALAGRQCRHNLNYWQFGDYLGLGAGAHGKVTQANADEDNRVLRTVRAKQPREYLSINDAARRITERSGVPKTQLPFEFMLNALRLSDGFSLHQFAQRTGLDATTITPTLSAAEARGLLREVRTGSWQATELGQRFLNDTQALFLSG
jgi:putative oxygen-independent coproporphyrinogen III oxidase